VPAPGSKSAVPERTCGVSIATTVNSDAIGYVRSLLPQVLCPDKATICIQLGDENVITSRTGEVTGASAWSKSAVPLK